MQNSEFEKRVQQKMEELKLTPTDAVWEKVAAGLPPEKKPRRWIIFFLLFGLLAISSLVWFNKYDAHNKNSIHPGEASKNTDFKNKIAKEEEIKNKPGVADTAMIRHAAIRNVKDNAGVNKKNISIGFALVKNNKTTKISAESTSGLITAAHSLFKTNAAAKLKIKASMPDLDEEEKLAADTLHKKLPGKSMADIYIDTTKASADILLVEGIQNKTDSSLFVINRNDTAVIVAASKAEKKKNVHQWKYGIIVAYGLAAVKDNLFSSKPIFADAMASVNNPSPTVPALPAPNNPIKGVAFSTGFYLQKNLNRNWSFVTGINYWYQSNTLQVGNKIDSAASFNFSSTKILTDNFYKTGNTISYKNKFHLLEVPLIFQYRFKKMSPLFAEAGSSLGYLIHSNALLYSGSNAAYLTDKKLFNQLIVSFSLGAGVNLAAKTNFPFSIGFKFKYSAVSVTKKYFGEQHFVNSMLYVKIPLKK